MTDIADKREGPHLSMRASCFGCTHEESESYRCQSDSGHDVYCTHPSLDQRKHIADTRWDTPAWCPAVNMTAIRARFDQIAKEINNAKLP